jgi:UDP-N-acetylmuramate dehydrogenase
MEKIMDNTSLSELRSIFGSHLQENASLAGYTAARIGGPADVLVKVHSAGELEKAAGRLWELNVPFFLLGGGANLLVSDKGVRGVVILNRARTLKFDTQSEPPTVYAESGATPNDVAQRAARQGLSGFEWAGGIPGTMGGAIYGNAGAFGGEIAKNMVSVDILHKEDGLQNWTVDQMEYGYRTSILKRDHPPVIILGALLKLAHGEMAEIKSKMDQYAATRKASQPHGASMGSMFKNPAGDKAGRLIEAAGLKGTRIGNAEISSMHGNFFISNPDTCAADMKALIDLAKKTVMEKFGIQLELEIELVGEWD